LEPVAHVTGADIEYSFATPRVKTVIQEFFVGKPLFIWKKSCSTCRKARTFLTGMVEEGAFEERELNTRPMSTEELDLLIGQHDYKLFLNSRNELYRARNMKDHPPTRAEAVKLMSREPNLIKRPLLIRGQRVVYGFDEDGFRSLVTKGES
jgi:arsenate reductase-like glutaredoxin family protein